EIGVAMARLRLLDRPESLNSGGTVVHVSGLAWAGRFGEAAEEISALEDVALSWRAHLHGLRVVVDPSADVFHEYEFGRNPTKIALLERNRLIFVLTGYPLGLLVLLGPVLACG